MEYKERTLLLDLPTWLDEAGIAFDERSEELIIEKCYNKGCNKKLYMNKTSGVYTCFKCGVKGGPVNFLMYAGGIPFAKAMELCYNEKKEPLTAKSVAEGDWEENFTLKKPGRVKKEEVIPGPIEIPNYFHKLTRNDSAAWEYLKKRGIPDSVIETLDLYYFTTGKRVVFMIKTDGEVMGYMARDITGMQQPKTLNSRGSFRSYNVWNYDAVKNSEELVICEGIFSAIKCGPNRSIALLGKVATKGQINLLKTIKAKKVYMGLDIGTDKEQKVLFEALSLYYPGKIYQIQVPAVVELKKEFSQETIDRINKQFKGGLKKEAGTLIKVPIDDKNAIKKAVQEKKIMMLPQETLELIKLIADSDYKDAGDYTFEEMDQFIKAAPLYKRM